jgi:arabinan endo-1,5-alpha-L-arabinosidase
MYRNPVRIASPEGEVESCPDPSIIRSQTPGDSGWYLYCTADLFRDNGPIHLMAIARSDDLIHWKYVGDVFQSPPPGAAPQAGLWAPDIHYFNGKYYLYYAVSATRTRKRGSAIYAATSPTPAGPWTPTPTPVVEPQVDENGNPRSTIDPAIIEERDHRYILYGGFNGGIFARELAPDNLTTKAGSELQIASGDRYEGAYVIQHEGFYYLFVSSSNCCQGDLTGYGVFAARSEHALGPYLDSTGHSLLEPRVGGTPVLMMNGNRWLGPGHNATFQDANGQDWIIYHAVDQSNPVFSNGWTRRPAMLDPIDWINGWPRVRGDGGPSENAQPAPALAPFSSQVQSSMVVASEGPGTLLPEFSDEFEGAALGAQWKWLRTPSEDSSTLRSGNLTLKSQAGDIYRGTNTAGLLTEPAPAGDYLIEVKLSTDVPLTGVHDCVQGGLMIYKDDGNYLKLVETSIGRTRQIEFAKQITTARKGTPRYGNTFLSPPGDSTWLRIVKHTSVNGVESFTAYSSEDGTNWERGGTWTHSLGHQTRIALVSMGGAGFTVSFDYVRVYKTHSSILLNAILE